MIAVLAVLIVAGSASADASKQLFDSAGKAGALAVFRCTSQTDFGTSNVDGLAVCIATQPKAVFITLSLNPRMAENISNLTLTPAGGDKTIKAELLGVDPETSIGFIAATEPYDKWSVIQFVSKANVSIGQLVTSVGLQAADGTTPPYTGMGYVSSILHTPQESVYVTGGKLTGPGSPVFNEEGKAIGLVGFQRPLLFQISTGQQPTQVAITGQDETSFFMPVDEFAQVLMAPPASPDKVRRLSWIGAGMGPVTKEVADIKKLDGPSVELMQVLPEQPAAKAGLKDGDIVVAFNGEKLEFFANPVIVARALSGKIARLPAGQSIKLTVRRGDANVDVSVPVAALPPLPSEAKTFLSQELGFQVREKVALDQYLDKSTGGTPGLVVVLVGNGTSAASAGMQQGDLVTSINGQAVASAAQAKKAIEDSAKADPKKAMNFTIRRGEQTQTMSLQMGTPAAASPAPAAR
jgi:serine protease Do